MSATELSRAERILADATAELESARDVVRTNISRLNDTRARMSEITQRRIGGTSTASDAPEYSALTGDEKLLSTMLLAAQQAEAQAVEKMRSAHAHLKEAQVCHAREQAQERYTALLEQTKQIEAMFIKALGAVGRAGQAIGISTMGSAYPKSNAIRQIFDLNIVPTEKA